MNILRNILLKMFPDSILIFCNFSKCFYTKFHQYFFFNLAHNCLKKMYKIFSKLLHNFLKFCSNLLHNSFETFAKILRNLLKNFLNFTLWFRCKFFLNLSYFSHRFLFHKLFPQNFIDKKTNIRILHNLIKICLTIFQNFRKI